MAVHQSPESGIADAFGELSAQTGALVRREIQAAQQEMWEKAKAATPSAGLLLLSGFLGMLGTVCAARLGLRVVEKCLPPATAALAGTVACGAGCAATAALGLRRLRRSPVPLPIDTAAQVVSAMGRGSRRA